MTGFQIPPLLLKRCRGYTDAGYGYLLELGEGAMIWVSFSDFSDSESELSALMLKSRNGNPH